MKGIILAGGVGSRLYPSTCSISKQIIPVYDKPMIYYPLSILMLFGITEILIISTPRDLSLFKMLLKDGTQLGMKFSYKEQATPKGLAEALIIGEDFVGSDNVTLILGDNIFYGDWMQQMVLRQDTFDDYDARIFAYYVSDPKNYGVVQFDANKKAVSIEEKPSSPKSNYAVTGLYIYNNTALQVAKKISPSARGELEITSVNNYFLQQGKLKVEVLGRGFAWFDTGTQDDLLSASNFVATVEKRQGLKIACIEEIAYKKHFISKEQLKDLITPLKNTEYGNYLRKIADDE